MMSVEKKGKIEGHYTKDILAGMVFAVPITNAVCLGTPAVLPWFTEAGASWQPPALRKKTAFCEASLLGYVKTSVLQDKHPG